jgi:hypothetical protein
MFAGMSLAIVYGAARLIDSMRASAASELEANPPQSRQSPADPFDISLGRLPN